MGWGAKTQLPGVSPVQPDDLTAPVAESPWPPPVPTHVAILWCQPAVGLAWLGQHGVPPRCPGGAAPLAWEPPRPAGPPPASFVWQ